MQTDFELLVLEPQVQVETKSPTESPLVLVPTNDQAKKHDWESFEYLYQYSQALPHLWYMIGYISIHNGYELVKKTKSFNALFKEMSKKPSDSRDLEALQNALDKMTVEIDSAKDHRLNAKKYCFNPPGRSQIQAFSTLLNKEKEAMNHEDQHVGYRLDWSSLREIHSHLQILKTQIIDKNYWYLWQWAPHSDCSELCEGILCIITNFSKWFEDDQIKQHKNRESHPSCRRAIQDLDYLMEVFNSNHNLLKRLQYDLPKLPEVMGLYRTKLEYALTELRGHFEKNRGIYTNITQSIKKIQTKGPRKAQARLAIQDGIQESLRKEDAYFRAFSQIRVLSNPKYNVQLQNVTQAELQSYSKIYQLSNSMLNPEAKVENISEEKSSPEGVNLTETLPYIPKKACKTLLDFDALNAFRGLILRIITRLETQEFYFIFFKRAAEYERLSLLDALHGFTQYFIVGNPNFWNYPGINEIERESRLKKAQEQLRGIIAQFHCLPELLAIQDDSQLALLIHKTLTLYQNKLSLNLYTLYQEHQNLQKHLQMLQKEYETLRGHYQTQGFAWKTDQLQDLVKITCDMQLQRRSPSQKALQEITELLKTIQFLEPQSQMALRVNLSILNKIIDVLMPSPETSLSFSH